MCCSALNDSEQPNQWHGGSEGCCLCKITATEREAELYAVFDYKDGINIQAFSLLLHHLTLSSGCEAVVSLDPQPPPRRLQLLASNPVLTSST